MNLTPPDALIALAIFLCILTPGALLTRLVWSPPAPWLVQCALWPGLSIAIIALLYQWLPLIGVRFLSPLPTILLILLACAAAGMIVLPRERGRGSIVGTGAVRHTGGTGAIDRAPTVPSTIVVLLIFLLTCALRIDQIRDLALPAWVDGVHHTLLVRVVTETGQPPLSLRPYLPVDRLPFHWGYHVLQALALQGVGRAAPLELPHAILLSGQLLSAMCVLTYAGAAQALSRRPLAGVVAGALVGVLSVMPAFYVSWGRYTLLAGVLALPAALISLQHAIRARSWRAMLIAAIALAGLSLTHFVMFVFALVWGCALALTSPQLRRAIIALAAMAAGTLLLTLPWALLLIGQARMGSGSSATHVAGNMAYNAMPIDLLWADNNRMLVALAAAGGLVGLARRLRSVAAILIWCLIIVLLANPVIFGLPYLSFVTNETVAITLFIPCALLAGAGAACLASWGARQLPNARQIQRLIQPAILGGMLLIAIASGANRRAIVRPDTVLATADDLAAIAWVAANTPPEARFLVNTAGWLGDVDRGADGGWWLLPLAGRQVSTPPVFYTYAADDHVAAVKRLTSALRRSPTLSGQEVAELMRREGFRYAYATEGGRLLSAPALRSSPAFEVLYANQRVTILRLR